MQTLLYILLIVLSIQGHALSWNPTLGRVGYVRQTQDVEMKIPRHVSIHRYECRVGLPYGYKDLIGREVYFLSDRGKLHGPWLVTDVEQEKHHYDKLVSMSENDLLADIDCKQYVHLTGKLLIAEYGKEGEKQTIEKEEMVFY